MKDNEILGVFFDARPLSFKPQNLSVKGIKTCVFHGLKHACFGSVH